MNQSYVGALRLRGSRQRKVYHPVEVPGGFFFERSLLPMPSTVSTDLDVPRSILHTQGISYINYCMSLAPGLLVFEGFFRARYYRSKVPPSRAVALGRLRMRLFNLARQNAPTIVNRPYLTPIPEKLKFVRNTAQVQIDVLKLLKAQGAK